MEKSINYNFDPDKNAWLIALRGISFEDIIAVLEGVGAIDVIEHPNVKKYPHQKMYIVELNDYIYAIPYVEKGNNVFLKTIFPNKKLKKKYLDKRG